MTTQERLEKLESATKIYIGKDRCCRCGCEGRYYTPTQKAYKSKVEEAKFALSNPDNVIEDSSTYVNISLFDNKAITFYFE